MSTVAIRIGPQDHGRRMSLADFEFAETEEGFLYELNRGVVTVTEVPLRRHARQVSAARQQFFAWWLSHSDLINEILSGNECKILVWDIGSERHPDLSIYLESAPDDDSNQVWRHWLPAIVIEVVSSTSRHRDYVEKREEYLRVGIQEYWIIDADEQRMTVLRRGDGDWIEQVVPPGEAYQTDLLPGFKFDCGAVFEAAGA